jgi:hypothetical protein
MVDHTQSLDGEAAVGDILVKIRGRHYLIPAEAIGSPLEDGGSEILGMLEKELSAVEASHDSRMIGVEFAMELGAGDDRNARAITDDRDARAITARQSRQCVRQARQCTSPEATRTARQCTSPEATRTARQCTSPEATRTARQCTSPEAKRTARQCTSPEAKRTARQCVRSARAIHPQAA